MFQSIYNTIKSNIQKSLKKGSSSIIDSIIDYNIGISKHSFTAGSNYIKQPQKLDHPRKGLINIKNIKDNECFKQCLVRCLNSTDRYPARIKKRWQRFCQKNPDFKDIKFPVKVRDVHKTEKKNPSA